MMIGRTICRKHALSSTSQLLHPYTLGVSPPQSPSPVDTTSHNHPFLGFVSYRQYISSCVPWQSSIGLNIQYELNRVWFSTQALAEIPAGGTVDVPLAQTGEGIAECELLRWFVKEGDEVEEFQPLCEVQSDKATIEITSRYKGKISQVLYVPGNIVKVGETLLKMTVEDSQIPKKTRVTLENLPSLLKMTLEDSRIPKKTHVSLENLKSLDSEPNKRNICEVISTPAVRYLAKQYGINLNEVHGTGKDGRVLKEDVLKYATHKGIIKDPAAAVSTGVYEQLPTGVDNYPCLSAEVGQLSDDKVVFLRGFQRTMVKTMSMAAKVPHFHYVEEINCDALVDLKVSFQKNNTDPSVKHTFLPFLIKSLSMALYKYPWMNSCFNEESLEVLLKGSHNIGIAMATPIGLVVPNIKNVQSLSILEITKELSRLQQLAVDNKLNPEDITGGTLTLSNIGAIGGKFGAPLLNLPEVAIIAVGRIQKIPHYSDDGNVYPTSIMTVNIGADHRVLDGATVANFCNEWKRLIEKPELLMLLTR